MTGLSDREAAPSGIFVTHPRCQATVEDAAILHRNILRLKRWLAGTRLSDAEKMRVLHRWTGDYLIR